MANSEGLAAIKEKKMKPLANNLFISIFGLCVRRGSRAIDSFSVAHYPAADSSMAVMMSTALLLVHDHAIHCFVSVPAGIVHRDRMVRTERMIINRRTVVIDERNISAVTEAPLLITHADADEVRAEGAPGTVKMVGHRAHR